MQPLPAHLAHSPEVIFQEVSGEMVLMHLDTEQYFGLDAVGRRIWELLGEHGDTEQVLATLMAEYEVTESRLRADLQRLLGELLEAGLLVSRD